MVRLLSLVEGPRDGDAREARFRACYEGDYRAVRRYVARLSGHPEDADDLTQEVFALLWRRLQQREDVSELRPFVYRIATNLVISRRRSRARTPTLELPVLEHVVVLRTAGADLEADLARRQLVERTLARLPEPMRQCVLLHHAGLTAKEISTVVGVSSSYVSTLVKRGHQRFRRERTKLEQGE
jgi:RNA polymerase sigma-70 factor (ECF subfamily)